MTDIFRVTKNEIFTIFALFSAYHFCYQGDIRDGRISVKCRYRANAHHPYLMETNNRIGYYLYYLFLSCEETRASRLMIYEMMGNKKVDLYTFGCEI